MTLADKICGVTALTLAVGISVGVGYTYYSMEKVNEEIDALVRAQREQRAAFETERNSNDNQCYYAPTGLDVPSSEEKRCFGNNYLGSNGVIIF